jgi:outer membrane protein insertion porin family
MKRPVPLLVLITFAFFALVSHGVAQQPPPQGEPQEPARPEPEPEPTVEPGEPLAIPEASPADAGAEEEITPEPVAEGEGGEGMAPAATAPTVLVPQTVCEGRKIGKIAVKGNGRVAADDVRATMKLKPGMACGDDEIAKDARALWDLGYFDDLIFRASTTGDAVDLEIQIKERPAIGKITFEGDDNVTEEDIDEKVTLEVGAILSENAVREQLTKIRDVYAEEGFFLAKVTYKLVPMANNQVEVRYDIVEGPEVSVRRIEFIGNDHIPAEDLLQFMRTHPTGVLSFLSSNDTFKRDFFDEDVLRIQALYYDRGYMNIQVDPPRVELTPDRHQIDITVPVREGPRFRIGRMRVVEISADGQEVEPLGGRRSVREKVETESGEWFSRTKVAEGIERITRHYRDASFAKVAVEPETELETDKRLVHVTVVIRRGPPCHVERIDIQGNDKTRDRVIRREILMIEGGDYSQTLLEASKDRINALGYFERVDMSETEGKESDGLIVTYEVKERATGTFQLGAGFSSIEQFILTAQIDQQNLFGHGQSLSLQAQVSTIRRLIQTQFVEPYFLSTMWSLSVDAQQTSNAFQDFTQNLIGGGVAFGHPIFHRNLRLSLRYSAEMVDVTETTGGFFNANAPGAQIQTRSPHAYAQLGGFTSALRLALTWDSRDNRLFPTKGVYASLSSEAADPTLGSQRTYVRHRYFGRFYYPLLLGAVLRLNTEAGLITSRDNRGVPQYERFYLGGILSLRGFPLQSVTPVVAAASTLDPTAATGSYRLGGNVMLRSNLEVEFPILTAVGIKGVIFTDAGNTWNLEAQRCQAPKASDDPARDPCIFDPLTLRYSWGFGVRWFSPMGPLRFEWGFPINKRAYEDTYRFEFTIGQFF